MSVSAALYIEVNPGVNAPNQLAALYVEANPGVYAVSQLAALYVETNSGVYAATKQATLYVEANPLNNPNLARWATGHIAMHNPAEHLG